MEQLLHYIWKHRLFPLEPLVTTKGQEVEVLDPGLPNRNAGPDFFNAKIKVGGVIWVGNIEIHESSADWMRHHHNTDAAYDSVILHVAEQVNQPLFRTNGEEIPQLELHCPDRLRRGYEALLKTIDYPACHEVIASLGQTSRLKIHSWLSALETERCEQKAAQILERLSAAKGDWERVFFITLARNFGFGVNNDAFEWWASAVPLSDIRKHRDQLLQVEAAFFGLAGFLRHPDDEYANQLANEYAFLKHKFGWTEPSYLNWRFLRLRPTNFPHVRIAQLACLYHRSEHLFSQMLETTEVEQVKRLFMGGTSAYWNTHYMFGANSDDYPKSLGRNAIELLLINTVVPFLYAYGRFLGDDNYCERAGEWLESLRPEDNHITRMWEQAGIKAQHAGDSQALIQLKKNYCDPKKCLYCRFGYEYFLKFVDRNP